MKRRALISVFDKTGVGELAAFLAARGWEILSTGGTAAYLKTQGLAVTDVAAVTGFPECLDGRVKTLHPAIHAGLLARRDEATHLDTLDALGLEPIDLVCVNLYPFFEKVQAGLSLAETVEFIDIGGPAMLRSAAKNYRDVLVLTDPTDYPALMDGLLAGDPAPDFRKRLAGKVFDLTSAYDAAIARYLLDEEYPAYWPLSLRKGQELRYGENGHQSAALYLSADHPGALGAMQQLQGKELSYNNIRDLDLAWKAAGAFADGEALPPPADAYRNAAATVVAVKHNSPCGIGQADTLLAAYEKAYACDPVSIFGGIVACSVPVDAATAARLAGLFLEIVAAPDFSPAAREIFAAKKNLRLLRMTARPSDTVECVAVDGGLLVQSADRRLLEKWEVVTKKAPDPADLPDLIFGLQAVRYVKSNAIVVAKDRAAIGIGGGQTNRIWAAEQALQRAAGVVAAAAAAGTGDGQAARVLASDAFFPFADVVEAAAARGIRSIVQPGGSIRDQESIAACDRLGIAMVFTGTRHFKH